VVAGTGPRGGSDGASFHWGRIAESASHRSGHFERQRATAGVFLHPLHPMHYRNREDARDAVPAADCTVEAARNNPTGTPWSDNGAVKAPPGAIDGPARRVVAAEVGWIHSDLAN
jgi:hypothetical protein